MGRNKTFSCVWQVIIEEIQEGYPQFTDPDDTIIFARRWYPSTRTLGEFQEVVIPSKFKSFFLGCCLIDIWMCLFLILGENGELCNVLSKMSGIPEENLEYTKVCLLNALLAHFLTFFISPLKQITNSFPRCSVSLMSIPTLIWYSQPATYSDRSMPNDGTLVFYM